MPPALPPTLSYAPPPGRLRARVLLLRTLMVTAGIVLLAIGICSLFNPLWELNDNLGGGALGTPLAPVTLADQKDYLNDVYLYQALAYLGMFLVTQWLFLFPRGKFSMASLGGGRLTRTSAAMAGFMAMLLSIGLLATLLELGGVWQKWTLRWPDAPATMSSVQPSRGRDYSQTFGWVWLVMLAMWVFWTIVFLAYARTVDRYTAMTRILRQLIAGTVLEMLVAAPAHAYVVRNMEDECYCTRGSYTGVVFGCTCIVWLFGPGTILLWHRERLRRQRLYHGNSDTPDASIGATPAKEIP